MRVNPNLPVHPTPTSSLGVHTFVLYACVSISALWIRSSVIPHVSVNIQLFFFSVSHLLHSNVTRGPGNAGNEVHCWKESWVEDTQLFSSAGKESTSSAGDTGSIPGLGRSSGEGIERPGLNRWVGKIPWRRAWQPTPVFLPWESHRQRSLVDYSTWGCKESDVTEAV